jgi:hypothetical protein
MKSRSKSTSFLKCLRHCLGLRSGILIASVFTSVAAIHGASEQAATGAGGQPDPTPAAQTSPASTLKSDATKKDATPAAPGDNIRYGYAIHQTTELGGHIASESGSSAVYDTMVNLHTGPRILNQSISMHAVVPSHAVLFDTLNTNSFGYGGEPNSVTLLNFSKGKVYDFRGSFRRDRQYFNYDLLDNPLIPPASVPDNPVLNSPHLFNTVRRMTDLNLTLAPLSPVSVRFGYNRNISEGPSYSSTHFGTEALLLQNWRNTSDSWTGGIDWKPFRLTSISYDEFITQYKGDTNWQLAGLNYKLSDGTPVSIGIDKSSVWNSPCAVPLNPDGTVNPTCNAFLSYSRSAPTRTFFPTEQLRFQSAAIPRFTLNGRLLYSGATSNLRSYSELFNGLETRTGLRESLVLGSARIRRVNVNGDLSLAWQITPSISATNLIDFWYYRMPGTNSFTETDYVGKSLLAPPGAATFTTTPDYQFLNQKTKTDTFIVAWNVSGRARISLGYRYRSRIITDAGGDVIPIHENWGLFGTSLRPTPLWRVNFDAEAMYADKSFTRISPRQLQHYRLRSTYKPQPWLTFAGTVNIYESRDNVQTVNHLEHNRDFSFGTTIAPSDRWSVDLNYGYDSVYSSTIECYTSTPAPPNAGIAPAVCVAAGTPLASTGYYNAPTQFGSVGGMWVPIKRVHLNGGYRMSAVNGNSDMINIRQVNGSLQSQYQSPYGSVAVDLAANWKWKADYNYYGYGEGSPIGPTASRSFRGNVYTLAVNYAF